MFLLATQAALDLIAGEPKIGAWASRVAHREISVSAISVGLIIEVINGLPPGDPARTGLSAALNQLLGTTHAAGTLLPFDHRAARRWAELLPLALARIGTARATVLSSEERMVVATAIEFNLILVDREQPYQATLAPLNLVTLDPY